jgi:hypothetical protein
MPEKDVESLLRDYESTKYRVEEESAYLGDLRRDLLTQGVSSTVLAAVDHRVSERLSHVQQCQREFRQT